MLAHPRLSALVAALALCAPAAAFTPGPLAASTSDGHWVELGAPARQEHTIVYDAVNHCIVLFGGRTNVASNAVYFLDLTSGTWARAEPAGAPPSARYGHAAVYDSIRQRMVIFGGYDGAPRDDAWALSLGATPAWTQLAPSGAAPPARHHFVGVYDSMRDRMLVHGGDGGSGALDDTWALSFADGESWSVVTPVGPAAPARAQHAGAYDPVRDRLILFSGTGDVSGEAWALDLATQVWDSLSTTGGPPLPLVLGAGVYDPLHDAFLVIGGYPGPFGAVNTWALSLSGTPAWSQKASPGRRALAATWVPALQGVVTHGGYAYSFTHTLAHLLDPGPFSSVGVLAQGGPWLRRDSEGIFDPTRNRLVIYGGDAASGFDTSPTADTWSMAEGPAYEWTKLSQFAPYHRMFHTLIHDPVGDRMILFAGDGVYGQDVWLDDTWSFDLASDSWTELTFTDSIPPSHRMHTSIYDPVGHRMIVFGGIVDGDYSNALWQLDLSGTPAWSPLAASGTPPGPRVFHAAVYDPIGRRMLVFDGSGPFTWPWPPLPASFNDLWELTLDDPPEWRQLAPQGVSPGGAHNARWRAVYDPPRHRVIVFGQYGAEKQFQLVLTDPPKWAPLVTTGPAPSGVPGQPLVCDPGADRLIAFGVNNTDGTLALELEPVGTVSVETPRVPVQFALRRVAPNPARGSVTISFDLPRRGPVAVDLIDIAGRRVVNRAFEALPAGRHDAVMEVPASTAPGVYFVRVRFESTLIRGKVAFIR